MRSDAALSFRAGMAYWLTAISVKPIYQLFIKYRLSVSVNLQKLKISVISYQLSVRGKYRLSVVGKSLD